MKIKAFSFERDSFTLSDVKKSVIETLDGAGLYFESFSNANAFFEAVSSSMDDNDAVILGIESSLYLKFKPILIKAFNFTPAYSSRIQSRIPGSISDEKTRKAHMLIPNESSELLTPDGLYSGFYVISEGKHIVVLPLKKELSVNLLKNTDFPFIKRKTISVVSVDEEPTDDILVKAEAVVQKLVEYDLTVAIPTTPAAATLQDRLNTIDGGDRIIFTPFVNDKGITEPKEYSAELARGAKELRNAEIGATISTIFREKKGDITLSYYAFIGVAIEDKVVVRKLIATADESVPNLVKEATIELYNLIDKYIDEYVFKADAPEEEIEKYINSGEPMDKAGAYGAQGYASLFVEALEGDFFNVMGLPLCALGNMLKELGVNLICNVFGFVCRCIDLFFEEKRIKSNINPNAARMAISDCFFKVADVFGISSCVEIFRAHIYGIRTGAYCCDKLGHCADRC